MMRSGQARQLVSLSFMLQRLDALRDGVKHSSELLGEMENMFSSKQTLLELQTCFNSFDHGKVKEFLESVVSKASGLVDRVQALNMNHDALLKMASWGTGEEFKRVLAQCCSLPGGLQIDVSTGCISGDPCVAVPVPRNFRVTASNSQRTVSTSVGIVCE